MERNDLLSDKPKTKNSERRVFTCNWHPHLAQLPSILKRNFYHLKNDRKLSKIFREPPLVAFRRARTIKSELVRTDLCSSESMAEKCTTPCGSCRSTCHLISQSSKVVNSKTNQSVPVAPGYCHSSNVIYAARCKKCDLIYVGETGDKISSRFSKHRYDAKKRPDNCELAKHFYENKDHDFEKDLEICILQQGFKSLEERRQTEDKFACRLGTLAPTGINESRALGDYVKEMYDLHQSM